MVLLTIASNAVDLNGGTSNVLQWDTQVFVGSGFFHDTSLPTRSRVYVNVSGWYLIGVNVAHTLDVTGGAPYRGELEIKVNGTTAVDRKTKGGLLTGDADTNEASVQMTQPVLLSAGEYFEVVMNRIGAYADPVYPIADQSFLWARFLGKQA
jgi:hypothetical protein